MPSLMDMFQPHSLADNQPIGFGDAIAQNRQSLIGLGMGLLQPRSLAVGAPASSAWSNALGGYGQGAQADSANAYKQAQVQHTQRQEDFQRQQAAQAQSNWQKEFALKGAGTYTHIGDDPVTGQPQFGFVNPITQSVTPYTPPAAQDPAAAVSGREATIDAILGGRMAPPTSFAASKPYWQGILAQAAQKEPGFDLTQWGARFGTAKDFGSGPSAKNVTSLDTVTGHLETLMEKANALDNSSFPRVNAVRNAARGELGYKQVTEFNLARNAVADELAKVFRSSGMSDTEIRAWKNNLDASGSPDQLKGAVKTAIELVDSRRDALKQQYSRTMGREPTQFGSEKAAKALERVRAWAEGGEGMPPAAAPATGNTGGLPPPPAGFQIVR